MSDYIAKLFREKRTDRGLVKMTAAQIVEALGNMHTNDVFVPECKDGPTESGSGHVRLDAWAMRRSWARPRVTGYEVKVNRQDFENDKKWPEYLPLCNELFFVCPKGLIKPEQMPGDVGLMYCLGQRFKIVKKATFRNVVVPESLYRYILMSRCQILPPETSASMTREERTSLWLKWVKEKQRGGDIGRMVSKAVREHVSQMELENSKLKQAAINLSQPNLDAEWVRTCISSMRWNVQQLEDKLKAYEYNAKAIPPH